MTFLLTGGNGYLGGRLAQYLHRQGHRVLVTSRTSAPDAPDVLSWPLTGAPEGIEAIIHLASPDQTAAGSDPAAFLATSAELSWQVCSLAIQLKPPPVVLFLSTFHVYGNAREGIISEETAPTPTHPYALGKLLGEEIIQLFRRRDALPAVCLRLSNAFGAPASTAISQWHLVFNDLCRQAVTQGAVTVRTSGQRRNFVTLTDVVRAIEFIASTPGCRPPDGILHIGSTLNLTISHVAEMVAGRAREILHKEIAVILPEPAAQDPSVFTFSTTRLASQGFVWTGVANEEIDNTLRICEESLKTDSTHP